MPDHRWLVRGMVVVDAGFLLYWVAIAGGVIPPRLMFAEYQDPDVVAWNWSFLPLDVAASVTGFAGLRGAVVGAARSSMLLVVSLTLTATAGGMALAFWAMRGQFDLVWWVPNVALLALGVAGLVALGRDATTAADAVHD
jgi:Family of unknown function (DUF5360)